MFAKAEPIQKQRKGKLNRKLKSTYKMQVEIGVDKWKKAIRFAEYPQRPDRRNLYVLYFDVEIDDQVVAQTRVARTNIVRAPFEIMDASGKPSEDLHKLFERTWFDEYLAHAVDAEFWGHSLIEFDPTMHENEFQNIVLIPREHVRPEQGDVLIQTGDMEGIQFRDNKAYKYLLEIGAHNDLGIYKAVALPFIRKRYADMDWSTYSEKFGMPFVSVTTSSRDKSELDSKEHMLKNFGANGYAILDDQDEIKFHESQVMNGHLVFKQRIELADMQIAKIINGQTSTSDEKSYVGAAEVHERILNDFTYSRMRVIQNHIRWKLMPFLTKHGYALEGAQFEFIELRHQDGSVEQPEKKKSAPKDDELSFYEHLHFHGETLAFKKPANDVGDNLIRQVYDRATSGNHIDSDLFKSYARAVMGGVADGFEDKRMSDFGGNLRLDDPLYDIKSKLRNNVFDFAASKTSKLHSELTDLLTDGQSKARPFAEFERLANSRVNLHRQWLRTEYQLATQSARSAEQWQQIVEESEVLPWLRYDAVLDGRVRDAHKALHGTTKRWDDDFWKEYYPPNGYNCRCDVIQLSQAEEKEPASYPDEKEIPIALRHNPGATERVFSTKHPYFKNTPDVRSINNQVSDLYVYDLAEERADNKVQVHTTHVGHERADNIDVAKTLLQYQTSTKLLPVRMAKSFKNPDAELDGVITDFKAVVTTNVKKGVQRGVAGASKQLATICLIDLRSSTENIDQVIRGLIAAFQPAFNKNVNSVWLLFKTRLVKLSRKDIEERNFETLD